MTAGGSDADPDPADPGQPSGGAGADTLAPPERPAGSVLAVGWVAPELSGPDTHGAPVASANFRGRAVLVVFVPFAFTPVCSGEIAALARAAPRWRSAGVEVVVISCDAVPTLRTWADQHAPGLTVVSDFWPHGRIATSFGAFSPQDGAADRVSVLIDTCGVVRWTTRAMRGRPRPVTDYDTAIDALAGAAPSGEKSGLCEQPAADMEGAP